MELTRVNGHLDLLARSKALGCLEPSDDDRLALEGLGLELLEGGGINVDRNLAHLFRQDRLGRYTKVNQHLRAEGFRRLHLSAQA